MEKVVSWKALIDLIVPHYPKTSSKGGRPPYPLATILRIHLLLQWYDLSDLAMEDALIEVPTMRRYAGIDMISDRIPDETTILDAAEPTCGTVVLIINPNSEQPHSWTAVLSRVLPR
jgi:transposase, IS5 family